MRARGVSGGLEIGMRGRFKDVRCGRARTRDTGLLPELPKRNPHLWFRFAGCAVIHTTGAPIKHRDAGTRRPPCLSERAPLRAASYCTSAASGERRAATTIAKPMYV